MAPLFLSFALALDRERPAGFERQRVDSAGKRSVGNRGASRGGGASFDLARPG